MNPRFERLIVAVGGNPTAFPEPKDDEEEGLPPYLPIKYAILRERLSKEEKRAKGRMNINSIDVQRMRIKAYAEREGWQVLGDYADTDLSGAIFEEGPQYKAMMKYVDRMPEGKRRATVIVFKSPDRMGRELRKMLNVLYDLEQIRVRIRFADFTFMTPETTEGYFQFVDFAKMAAFERMLIKSRTQDALDERVALGVHLGHFPKHFHKDDEGRIEPDLIAEQVVQLRLQGLSYIEIGKQLSISDNDAYAIAVYMRRVAERMAVKVSSS